MELLKKYNNNFHHNLDFYHTPNRTYSLGTTFVQVHHFFTLSKADTKAASSLNVSLISSENFLWIPSNSSIYCCGPYKWILEKWVLSHYVTAMSFIHFIISLITWLLGLVSHQHKGFKQGLLRVVTSYVPSLNSKPCSFAYWGGSHVTVVGILLLYLGFCLSLSQFQPIFVSFVTIIFCCPVSLFQSHVSRRNFALTGPLKSWMSFHMWVTHTLKRFFL